jgi:hypothetical protein
MGTSVPEMVQLHRGADADRPETLTLEQEKALAADPGLFACYHLVANGREQGEIQADLGTSQRAVVQWFARLKALGLVAHSSSGRNRGIAATAVQWRPDGPVRRMYEQEVRAEFLHSLFGAEREALHFRSAELSAASCRVLQRKLEKLAAEFRDLADLDSTLPSSRKRNVGCLLAMRPWVFSRFTGSTSKAGRGWVRSR